MEYTFIRLNAFANGGVAWLVWLKIIKVGEDLCISGAETLPQETVIATSSEVEDDFVPLPPLLTEEEMRPPSVSSHPSNTQSKTQTPTN